MRRILFLILCLFIFFGSAYAQRMSDEQVVEYVKQAQAAGKSQKQMTAELLRRGVTREQVLRIKDKYENSGVAVKPDSISGWSTMWSLTKIPQATRNS